MSVVGLNGFDCEMASGANRVIGNHPARIRSEITSVLSENGHKIRIPELWDGKAAERIVDVLMRSGIQGH